MSALDKLAYDPSSGVFTWAVSGRGIKKGARAGSLTSSGYWQIKVGRQVHAAHRLAWFFSRGEFPLGEVDHINGERLDNRIENLRVVGRAGNSQNQRVSHRDNHSCGLLGVTWNKQHKCWQSKLQADKKMHHVGYFGTAQDAHRAYVDLKRRLHATCSI